VFFPPTQRQLCARYVRSSFLSPRLPSQTTTFFGAVPGHPLRCFSRHTFLPPHRFTRLQSLFGPYYTALLFSIPPTDSYAGFSLADARGSDDFPGVKPDYRSITQLPVLANCHLQEDKLVVLTTGGEPFTTLVSPLRDG